MSTGIELRKLDETNLPAIADLHARAFPDGALTMLGKSALLRYYDWQMTGPHDSVAMGAFVDHGLAGFCFAGVFRGATSGFLKKNRMWLTLRLLTRPWLLCRPQIRGNIPNPIRLVTHGRNAAAEPNATVKPTPKFGILAIAVAPQHRRLGIGKELMRDAEQTAIGANLTEMILSVRVSNHNAIEFYESLGWRVTTRVSQTRQANVQMQKSLVIRSR